jgi:hypothetical protein
MQKRVKISLNCAKQVAFSESPNYQKVVELASKTITMLQECNRMSNLYSFLKESKNEAILLKANSLSSLGDHQLAYNNYEEICIHITNDKNIKYPNNGCNRINHYEAAALYGCAVELLSLIKLKEAKIKAKILLYAGPIFVPNPDLSSDIERIEDSTVHINEWHTKAKVLINAINDIMNNKNVDYNTISSYYMANKSNIPNVSNNGNNSNNNSVSVSTTTTSAASNMSSIVDESSNTNLPVIPLTVSTDNNSSTDGCNDDVLITNTKNIKINTTENEPIVNDKVGEK